MFVEYSVTFPTTYWSFGSRLDSTSLQAEAAILFLYSSVNDEETKPLAWEVIILNCLSVKVEVELAFIEVDKAFFILLDPSLIFFVFVSIKSMLDFNSLDFSYNVSNLSNIFKSLESTSFGVITEYIELNSKHVVS